jgi:hypothetical protein
MFSPRKTKNSPKKNKKK